MSDEAFAAGAYAEAQASVLGSILIDADAVGVVMAGVRDEDFSIPAYRTLIAAARRLWTAAKPVDPVTVQEEAGGDYRDVIRQCMEETPTAARVGYYCQIVREGRLFAQIRETAERILDSRKLGDAMELLAGAENLAAGNREVREVSVRDAMVSAYMRTNEPGPRDWIQWGFPKLMEILRVPPGKFVVLAADSSVGKTALALQMAWSAASRGRRVAFYSLETDDETLGEEISAQRTGISLEKIQDKQLQEQDWKDWIEVYQYAERLDMRLVDASRMTLAQIRSHILLRRPEVVFIDYLQMLEGQGRDTAEKIRSVSIALHKMAEDLHVTIVGLSQLTVPSDAADKWVPTNESLRESRQLKNDADVILMLYLHRRSDRAGGRWLSVTKNKLGRLGKIYLKFDGPHLLFSEAPPPKEKNAEPTNTVSGTLLSELSAAESAFIQEVFPQ